MAVADNPWRDCWYYSSRSDGRKWLARRTQMGESGGRDRPNDCWRFKETWRPGFGSDACERTVETIRCGWTWHCRGCSGFTLSGEWVATLNRSNGRSAPKVSGPVEVQ